MNEDERAAYYEAHKNDFGDWGTPEQAPPRKKNTLEANINVRLSRDEAAELRAVARREGLSYGVLVRRALHAYLHPVVHLDARALRQGSTVYWSLDGTMPLITLNSAALASEETKSA